MSSTPPQTIRLSMPIHIQCVGRDSVHSRRICCERPLCQLQLEPQIRTSVMLEM